MLLGKIYQHTQLTHDTSRINVYMYVQHTSDKSKDKIDTALRNVKNVFI
jgi:hypothetical protein